MAVEPVAHSDKHAEPWRVAAHHEDDTESLGRALGKALAQGRAGGAIIGPLGAGRTRLAKSIAAALGADRRTVNSPTFVLIQEYAALLPIFHCDTYRLRSVDEFLDLGVDEMFQSEGVCLIEWADRVTPVLPADRLQIEIEVAGATARNFLIRASAPEVPRCYKKLEAALSCRLNPKASRQSSRDVIWSKNASRPPLRCDDASRPPLRCDDASRPSLRCEDASRRPLRYAAQKPCAVAKIRHARFTNCRDSKCRANLVRLESLH